MGTYLKHGPSGVKVLEGVTTGTSRAIAFNDCRDVSWLVVGSAGIASGAVVIECAHAPDYSGTWKALTGSPLTAVASAAVGDSFGKMPTAGYVRARISTTIGSGTVDVYLNGLADSD